MKNKTFVCFSHSFLVLLLVLVLVWGIVTMVVSKLVRLVTAKLLNYKLQIVSELPNYIQQF